MFWRFSYDIAILTLLPYKPESVYRRRIDNAMDNMTNNDNKTLHRQEKIKQYEAQEKPALRVNASVFPFYEILSIQSTISLEMPVPSQDHCGFPVSRLLTDFVCLLIYEFWISLWKIALCSVILLLPLLYALFKKIVASSVLND